jgi:hypothetical protein
MPAPIVRQCCIGSHRVDLHLDFWIKNGFSLLKLGFFLSFTGYGLTDMVFDLKKGGLQRHNVAPY